MNQPQGLISVLLDHNASISERDDAAMDLEQYKTPESEKALISTLIQGTAGSTVLESCLESLSKIMPRDIASDYNWAVEVEYFMSNHKEQLTSRLKCL